MGLANRVPIAVLEVRGGVVECDEITPPVCECLVRGVVRSVASMSGDGQWESGRVVSHLARRPSLLPSTVACCPIEG
jgi:hypothetical protein